MKERFICNYHCWKHIYFAVLILVLSSCAVRQATTQSQMPNEKGCAELYGELETKAIPIRQDLVSFFCYEGPTFLPKSDTVEITVPSKLNSNILNFDPNTKAFFAYNNGASIWINYKQYNSKLEQRIWDAVMRIQCGFEGETFFVPETTITEGIDENGLCWRTVNFEFMSYGYGYVPPEHKWYFDKILESFHKKTPSYQEVFEELLKTL
ncbi:MAG: hypothetical protein MJZ94_03750 [Bacteroidales bacterium]|nr:hypothetical protein [Bacteroidales bacterium]